MTFNSFRPFLNKIPIFLERLSSRPVVGGLQITNAGIQYVRLGEKKPETFALRFPPGVIQDGKVQNAEQFAAVLRELHKAISPEKPDEVLQITVALPAGSVFTQSFEVPNVEKEKLEESAMLNLQMISPLPAQNAYMSWEILQATPEHYEMLGAFTEKNALDTLRNIFLEEHFHPVAFEFPALSLSRLFSEVGDFDAAATLLLQVTSDGIDLSVIRRGKLYFDYFRSWHSIQGESKEISRDVFDSVVAEDVRKVANFSLSRFKEGVTRALLVAPGFEKEVGEILQNRIGIPAASLLLPNQELSPAWYVARGAALREAVEIGETQLINLNYETSKDLFFEEHVIGFVRLWRNVFSIVFGFFLIIFAVTAFYLAGQYQSLEQRLVVSKNQIDQSLYQDLVTKSEVFNNIVETLQSEPRQVAEWYSFFSKLKTLAGQYQIVIQRIDAASLSGSIGVSASAPDNAKTLDFKNALESDPTFLNIDLPLANIRENADNSVSFSINFSVNTKTLE